MSIATPFARPIYVMAKPAGATCNLACRYCYYLEKKNLYKNSAQQMMSDELLERFIREYSQSVTTQEIFFTWHGGEPLMRSQSFFEKVIRLEQRYAGGRWVVNSIQTNGTLLTDEWCEFFHKNGWLVGISIDGRQEYHDAYRKTRAGKGSWEKVMQGINLLNKHGVEWNALAVVNRKNGDDPVGFYRFFKEIECKYLQFTPVVERLFPHDDGRTLASADEGEENALTDFSVTPEQWGGFLCQLFDEWVRKDVGVLSVQLFEATLANWAGITPGVCTMSRSCGHAGVMEWNGDVFSCDHFVFPQYKLGSLKQHSLVEMMYSPQQKAFGNRKMEGLPTQCKKCQWLFACNGECPRNRFCQTKDGEKGLNYLCEGYKKFFLHVSPYMEYMKKELVNGRSPSNIMGELNVVDGC